MFAFLFFYLFGGHIPALTHHILAKHAKILSGKIKATENNTRYLHACGVCNGTLKQDIKQRLGLVAFFFFPTLGMFWAERIYSHIIMFFEGSRVYRLTSRALKYQQAFIQIELNQLVMISKTAKLLEKQGVKEDAILKSVIAMTASSQFCRAIVSNGLEALHKAAAEVKFEQLSGTLAARRLDVGLSNIGHNRDGSNHAINEINQLLADLSLIQRESGAFTVTFPKSDDQDREFAGVGVPTGIYTAHGRDRMVSTFTGVSEIDDVAFEVERAAIRRRRPITIAGNYSPKFKQMWFGKRWYNQLLVSWQIQSMMNDYERRMTRYCVTTPSEFQHFQHLPDMAEHISKPKSWWNTIRHPLTKSKAMYVPIYKSNGGSKSIRVHSDFFIEAWAEADGIKLEPGHGAALGPYGGIYRRLTKRDVCGAFLPAIILSETFSKVEGDKTVETSQTNKVATSASASIPATEPGNKTPSTTTTTLCDYDENSLGKNPLIDDDYPFAFGTWSFDTSHPASPASPIIQTDYKLPVNKATQPKKKREHKKTAWQELISTAESMAVVEGYKQDACYACIEFDVINSTDTADEHHTSECKIFQKVNGVNRHPVHDASCWGCHKPRHDDDEECRKTSDFVFRMASWSLRNPKSDLPMEHVTEC